MSVGATTKPDDTPRRGSNDGHIVPNWMIALMVLLFVAVVALSAFLIWGLDEEYESPQAVEIAKLRQLSDRDSDDAKVRTQLAYALQTDGQYREAIKIYDGALKLDSRNLGAMYNKGVCLMQMGDEAEGASVLKEILAVAPKHVLAAKELAHYYYREGNHLLGVQALGPVVEAHPTMSDLQALLGRGLEELGEYDQAFEHYEAALKTNPELREARDGIKRLEVRAK